MITKEEFDSIELGDMIEVSVMSTGSICEYSFNEDKRIVFLYCVPPKLVDRIRIACVMRQSDGVNGWCLNDREEFIPHAAQIKKICSLTEDFVYAWHVARGAIRSIRKFNEPNKNSRDTTPIPCAECLQFYPMAEPNCEDKKTLVCFSCRTSKGWKYETKNGVVYLRK